MSVILRDKETTGAKRKKAKTKEQPRDAWHYKLPWFLIDKR